PFPTRRSSDLRIDAKSRAPVTKNLDALGTRGVPTRRLASSASSSDFLRVINSVEASAFLWRPQNRPGRSGEDRALDYARGGRAGDRAARRPVQDSGLPLRGVRRRLLVQPCVWARHI